MKYKFFLALPLCLYFCCDAANAAKQSIVAESPSSFPSNQTSKSIVVAARAQIGVTQIYDGAYIQLEYPGGDIPLKRGVCTDVVVRALRDASDIDLQKLVHEDMKTAFSKYPQNWGLTGPDRNIDHRRVPNLQCYFKRKGYALPVTQTSQDYQPGDLVTCTVPKNRPHIMIVSDRKASDGTPLVIHNIGRGTQEENRLFEFPLTGHYRIPIKEGQGLVQTQEEFNHE